MRKTRIRAVAVLLLFCCGCDSYTSLAADPGSVGKEVRVTLTDAGATQIAAQVGGVASEVNGHVKSVTDTSVVLSVSHVTRMSGAVDAWNGETVTIPRVSVATFDQRKPSVAKSVAVGVAIVAGAIIVGNAVGGNQTTGTSGGATGPATGH